MMVIKKKSRRLGRRPNPNQQPANTTLRVRMKALDKLDMLVTIPRMPLGLKLESALTELEYLRKKVMGQPATTVNQSSNNEQQVLIHTWSDEELKVLQEAGWTE